LSVLSIVTTCIGIPLFGSEVSPRFCFADRILVVEVEQGRESRRFVISLGEPWLPGRVSDLGTLGVRTLLCGGFNRTYLPTAESLGIQVITGVSGDAEDALAAFLRGQIIPGPTRMRRCRRVVSPAK
jgi:predicted Fe-Mo cluster-binding NifX family protein